MEVRLLGALEAAGEGGAPLPVPGAKLRALLAMLALDCGRVVPTDRLIDGLWQDDPPAGAANSLQRLVSKLRKVLGPGDAVAMRPPGYVLAIDPDDVDVHRCERLVAEARELGAQGAREQALARFAGAERLWRGEALADFTYDEFAQPHIARLHELRLSATEDRVDVELALARHQGLTGDLEVLVAEHPTRERLRGQLMLALYRSGRQSDALRVFQDGRTVLAEELGLDPGPELRALETAILHHDPALGAPSPPSAPPPERPRRRTNARSRLTRLVGRERELGEIAELLAGHRLVTLVGPGGAGKTRLAVETAHRALAGGDGDVIVVELAAVGDPDAVAATVAAAFDLPDPEVQPLARVREHCGGRDVLVILDNCEHLVDAAAGAAEALLAGDGSLRLLTTSREALRVPGEAVWVVPPLQAGEAVELFVERAHAAGAGLDAGDAERAAIAEICERLDGLPLAIELAAARTRAFTLGQIAERLDDRFRLLTGGARTAMARQQTLRAVVDWSYDLLFADERRVFERLSVFPGGCTLTTAETVCADDQLDRADVVDSVAGLVDRSLLTVDRSGPEARYGMLQTLSHYGRERLVERSEADVAFGRMAAHMAAVCRGSRTAFRGTDQREWFRAVDSEQDNIRTAFEWAIGVEDKDLAVALAADIAFARWIAGGTAEGLRWLDQALGLAGEVDPFTDGWARMWHAFLSFVTGHRDHYEEHFDEAVARLRDHADPVFAGYALSFQSQLVDATGQRRRSIELNHALLDALAASADRWAGAATPWVHAALAVQERGDFAGFEAGLRDAAQAYRAVGDQFMTAVCLDLLAELAENRGDLSEAKADLTEALHIVTDWEMRSFEAALTARLARAAVQDGDDGAEALVVHALGRADDVVFRPGRAMSLNTLANLRRRQGRLDEAEAAALDALEQYRQAPELRFSSSFSRAPTPFDVPVGASTALSTLGYVADARGRTAEAIERHRAAYEAVAATGHPRAIPLALDGLAAAALRSGDLRWAGQLLGCSDALRTASGAKRTPTEQADADRIRSEVVAATGHDSLVAALDEGARLPADRLIAGPAPA
jgi:predicted ATPase/DNA-binding SARP family transcriptional activator